MDHAFPRQPPPSALAIDIALVRTKREFVTEAGLTGFLVPPRVGVLPYRGRVTGAQSMTKGNTNKNQGC